MEAAAWYPGMSMKISHTEEPLQIDRANWRAIPAEMQDGLACETLSRRRARAWALVLEARGIKLRIAPREPGCQLLVPVEEYDRALEELRQYEKHNRNWPPPPPVEPTRADNSTPVIAILLLLAVFHHLTLLDAGAFGLGHIDWLRLGNAHAGRILQGEWWRLLTSLTLHSGWPHLFSNLCVGGLFIIRLCRDLGAGLGWLLLLSTGLLGNLVNAFLQAPDHRAIGASTAVFGVIGALAAMNLLRYRLSLYRRWALPLAGALGLLALLGAGGENTDLGAHLFGFAAGVGLGLLVEVLIQRYGRPERRLNRYLALVSGVLLFGSWSLAILWG